MKHRVVCAATPTSGVRHRLMMMSAVKHFADAQGYSVLLLWGVSGGVSRSRFEELFAPHPGITVENLLPEQFGEVRRQALLGNDVMVGRRTVHLHHPGEVPDGDIFSWDLAGAWSLAKLVPGRVQHIVLSPSACILQQANSYVRANGLVQRLGIRVRVEELPYRDRKPHRITKELDQAIKSIIRIPWYVKVFIATDSEYVQQALASHFVDNRFLPKNFDEEHATGRYVHRLDKHAMCAFIKEVECLRRCRNIINIGGFLNDHSVSNRIFREPYTEASLMHLQRR